MPAEAAAASETLDASSPTCTLDAWRIVNDDSGKNGIRKWRIWTDDSAHDLSLASATA